MTTRTVISAAYDSIPDIPDGFNTARDRIYRAALDSERAHRKGRFGTPRDFPASLAAKYFTVKWLAEYTRRPSRLPTIAEIHRLRPDVVLAASFAADNVGTLHAWAMAVPAEFWALDYAEMMK